MRQSYGVDCSNWQGELTPKVAACLRESNCEYLIAGTQTGNDGNTYTRQQIEAAASVGIITEAYVWLRWGSSPILAVQAALAKIQGLPVDRLWLDCEEAPGAFSPAQIVAFIKSAVSACGNFPCGIYTGAWWWVPNTGNSQELSYLPLWHAGYTHAGWMQGPRFDTFHPYGGWTQPHTWQYDSNHGLCTWGVDLNVREVVEDMPEADQMELTLLRAKRQLDKALINGPLITVPGPTPNTVELHRIIDGQGHPFNPPLIIPLD